MKFQDLIALASSGWSLSDIKEALELTETHPAVQEAAVEELQPKEEPAPAPQPQPEPIAPVEAKPTQAAPNSAVSVLDKLFE